MEVEQLARILNLFCNENEGFEEALMYRNLLAMLEGSASIELADLKVKVEKILRSKLWLHNEVDFLHLTCTIIGEYPWKDSSD